MVVKLNETSKWCKLKSKIEDSKNKEARAFEAKSVVFTRLLKQRALFEAKVSSQTRLVRLFTELS